MSQNQNGYGCSGNTFDSKSKVVGPIPTARVSELIAIAKRIIQPLTTTYAVADYHKAIDELKELIDGSMD